MAVINRLDDGSDENCLVCDDCRAQVEVCVSGARLFICGHCITDLAAAVAEWNLPGGDPGGPAQTWH